MPTSLFTNLVVHVKNEIDALLAGKSDTAHAHAYLGCRVTCPGNPTIPNNAGTPIPWDAEVWDRDAMHDNATNNTRLTCRTAGVYLVIGNISIWSNPTGLRSFWLKKNGTTVTCWNGQNAVVGDSTYGSVVGLVELAVGDYIEVYGYQNSGGSLNLVGGGSWFQAARLGP